MDRLSQADSLPIQSEIRHSVINQIAGGSNLILNRYHRAIGDYDNLGLDLILGVSIRFNFSTRLQIFMEIHFFFFFLRI